MVEFQPNRAPIAQSRSGSGRLATFGLGGCSACRRSARSRASDMTGSPIGSTPGTAARDDGSGRLDEGRRAHSRKLRRTGAEIPTQSCERFGIRPARNLPASIEWPFLAGADTPRFRNRNALTAQAARLRFTQRSTAIRRKLRHASPDDGRLSAPGLQPGIALSSRGAQEDRGEPDDHRVDRSP